MMNFLPAQVSDQAGDKVSVEVAGLGRAELDAAQCPSGVSSAKGEIGVRPESLTVLYEGQHAEGGREATGTVKEVVYYGDMTYYDVLLDGTPAPVRVSMRNMPGRRVLDIETRARLAWDPKAMTLFC
jgi:spermidine/putrescine transport system ATP-binding protein